MLIPAQKLSALMTSIIAGTAAFSPVCNQKTTVMFTNQHALPCLSPRLCTTFRTYFNVNTGTVGTFWCNKCVALADAGRPFLARRRSSLPSKPSLLENEKLEKQPFTRSPTIAIVGGGIAGVTAAAAIAKRVKHISASAKIVILEASHHDALDTSPDTSLQPQWMAASAKNANSVVPASSMHIMSQRSVLYDIAVDTVKNFVMTNVENAYRFLRSMTKNVASLPQGEHLWNIDNFDYPPPYFSMHLLKCLGPSATWEDRIIFATFIRHVLWKSLRTGQSEADGRAKYIVQLANANRVALMQETRDNPELAKNIGLSHGFVSLHRKNQTAELAVLKAHHFGQESKILSWDEALALEPRIQNLPFRPIYAVHRPDDITGSCSLYVKDLAQKCSTMGVEYRSKDQGAVETIQRLKNAL